MQNEVLVQDHRQTLTLRNHGQISDSSMLSWLAQPSTDREFYGNYNLSDVSKHDLRMPNS